MNPDRWQRLRELFEAASRLGPGEREEYLDEACAGEPDLRREVESLLAADGSGDGPLTGALRKILDPALPRDRQLAEGEMLGRFRVLEKIGEGGMGEVYRAEDTALDREVALKVLPAELASDPQRLARFEREAKSLAALEHPNIVSIHSIESSGGAHYLTMQLVEGQRLADLIPPTGMAVDQILQIAAPLADALAAAHGKGIVHRDLKPANVMLTETGEVMVLDFGLAKLGQGAPPEEARSESLTGEGHLLGTPPYMSPEQVEGKELDARSDLFSLGVMLYEMATGERPFQGESSAAVIASILKDAPPAIDTLRADLPQALSGLIGRCLEKNPERRFQSADDLRRELETLKAEVDSRPRARRRWWARVAALLSVSILATIVAATLYWTWPGGGETADQPIHSLAVLPFENLMEDPEQDYFVDGMTDALINRLAAIGTLKVISRTSIMRFKGKDRLLPEIARELGVEAVVEGAVLRAGDQVRVTAQLVEASTDRPLWAQAYQRELKDILRLQSELARSIAGEIRVQLTPQQRELLAEAREVDSEAHDAYLKGRFLAQRESVIGFTRALDHFRRALEIDPEYAAAHAGLADAIAFLALFGARPPAAMEAAKAAAARALELDGNLAEAHDAMAVILASLDWDWSGAEEHHRRAIELSPSSGTSYYRYSMLLRMLRRYDEAIETASRAVELDPLSASLRAQYGGVFYHARDYDKAIELLERVVEMDPWFEQARWNLFLSCAASGAHRRAVEVFERLRWEDGSLTSDEEHAVMRDAYASSGWRGFLEAIDELNQQRALKRARTPFSMAVFPALLGRREEALDWLERAERERDPALPWINSDPAFDPLRDEPRFQDLLRRMGFPPPAPGSLVRGRKRGGPAR